MKRTAISFSILILFFIAVFISFRSIQKESRVGGAPATLRKSFLFNEEIAKIFRSTKRLSVEKPVPRGKTPRVNGMVGLKKPLDLENFMIQISQGEKKLTVSMGEIYAFPKSGYSTDFRCIEGWSEETQYAGVRFSEFLEKYQLGKKPDGTYYAYVGLATPDQEYYVSIDMESMLHPQTVLAYEMNEMPLSLPNGAPVRLIIPVKYGIKSLKRIGSITFSDSRPPDYWAERGYDWYSGL